MKQVFLSVLIALTMRASAGAHVGSPHPEVTYQTAVPDANGGLLVNVPVDLDFNESRTVQWNTGDGGFNYAVAQNFTLSSDITMDKYAIQLRADAVVVDDQVVQLPANNDPPITVSLWALPNLNSENYGYPGASAGGVPIATWTLTVGEENDSNNHSIDPNGPGAHAADWLIFDTPNIALTAGVQYGIQLAWPEQNVIGQKILIWVALDEAVWPDGYPINLSAIASQGDLTLDASYINTYRSENFAIIAASAGVPGDYNGNGKVDAADYVLWRKGGPLQNEVDNPGTVNAADYTAWRARFGNPPGSGSGSSLAVPEPGMILLVGMALGLIGCCRVKRHANVRASIN